MRGVSCCHSDHYPGGGGGDHQHSSSGRIPELVLPQDRNMVPLASRVVLRSVSCHVEKSHPVSSGVGAANVTQLEERSVRDRGAGDDLIPNAQAQGVLIRDDFQDDFLGSSH